MIDNLYLFSDHQLQNLEGDLGRSNKAAHAEGTRKILRVQWESYLLFYIYFDLVSLPASTKNYYLCSF